MENSKVNMYALTDLRLYDPTNTIFLSKLFMAKMNKRFDELCEVIKQSIVDNDCFGLNITKVQLNQMTPIGPEKFAFARNEVKLSQFMLWIEEQVKKGILETVDLQQVGSGVEGVWTNRFIYDSYKRGLIRARAELIRAGYDVPKFDEFNTIEAVLGSPFHIDRLGLVFTRAYSELKGITDAMDTQISRILAQGLADGDGPALLARKLLASINGTGGNLGIKDSLGRVISPRQRAQLLTRTEIIRAHHLATIQEYRNWKVEGVNVMAEFVTAGDRRVCGKCLSLAKGGPYTLDQIEKLIPYHPNCRCIALPFVIE
jgi:SPP1 gp7 family putative phage head morphogenesis protein